MPGGRPNVSNVAAAKAGEIVAVVDPGDFPDAAAIAGVESRQP